VNAKQRAVSRVSMNGSNGAIASGVEWTSVISWVLFLFRFVSVSARGKVDSGVQTRLRAATPHKSKRRASKRARRSLGVLRAQQFRSCAHCANATVLSAYCVLAAERVLPRTTKSAPICVSYLRYRTLGSLISRQMYFGRTASYCARSRTKCSGSARCRPILVQRGYSRSQEQEKRPILTSGQRLGRCFR
jgi:hypothetical protein